MPRGHEVQPGCEKSRRKDVSSQRSQVPVAYELLEAPNPVLHDGIMTWISSVRLPRPDPPTTISASSKRKQTDPYVGSCGITGLRVASPISYHVGAPCRISTAHTVSRGVPLRCPPYMTMRELPMRTPHALVRFSGQENSSSVGRAVLPPPPDVERSLRSG